MLIVMCEGTLLMTAMLMVVVCEGMLLMTAMEMLMIVVCEGMLLMTATVILMIVVCEGTLLMTVMLMIVVCEGTYLVRGWVRLEQNPAKESLAGFHWPGSSRPVSSVDCTEHSLSKVAAGTAS